MVTVPSQLERRASGACQRACFVPYPQCRWPDESGCCLLYKGRPSAGRVREWLTAASRLTRRSL